jgi:hypothetical protein
VVNTSVLQEGDPRATALSPLTGVHRQLTASGSGSGQHRKSSQRQRARSPVSMHADKGAHGRRRRSTLLRTRVVAG